MAARATIAWRGCPGGGIQLFGRDGDDYLSDTFSKARTGAAPWTEDRETIVWRLTSTANSSAARAGTC